MWVFDDPRFGLVQEAFISGADVIIDRAVAHTPEFDVEGWLCPALLNYFDAVPRKIFFQVKSRTQGQPDR